MAPIHQITSVDVILLLSGFWLLSKCARLLRRRAKPTYLKGPTSKSFIFGVSRFLRERKDADASLVLEEWAEQYGAVFRMPVVMGRTQVVLCDPKAIQHVYSRQEVGYVLAPSSRIFIKDMIGNGIFGAEGESHKRQRKALTPGFSNSAIRKLAPVFLDSAYKVKVAWDALLESSIDGDAIIDVQGWMNNVSLDTIGIAGFSHDFGTLQGNHSTIAEVFESFGKLKQTFFQVVLFILSTTFPILMLTPGPRRTLLRKFSSHAEDISKQLLESTRKEKDAAGEGQRDHSVIGLLIKASRANSAESHISEGEIMAQMKTFIFAGYETTSITLTWALIELSKNQSVQAKLREELICQYRNSGDPTYDQLTSGLPYLDAVAHEVLRVHAPVWETIRVAAEDDSIPLSVPLQTAHNETVNRVSITAGQWILIPVRSLNRSTNLWGPDAKEFRPQRWLEEGGIQGKANSISSYRHLLTFGDGPKVCLGKSFALAEFKATLSVLVRNYTFALQDGPDTNLEIKQVVLPRPNVVGEDGCRTPLRVRRADI